MIELDLRETIPKLFKAGITNSNLSALEVSMHRIWNSIEPDFLRP